MPIIYLDQPKSKITYLDEPQAEVQSPQSMGLGKSVMKAVADTNPTEDIALGPVPGLLNRTKQNFFGIHPEKDPSNIGEFAKDYFTDPRTYMYAGAGAMAGLPKGPNIGGFMKSLKRTPFNSMAAEEAVGAFKGRLSSMEPEALAHIKLPPKTIGDITSTKTNYGLKNLPSVDEAGTLFSNTMVGAKGRPIQNTKIMSALNDAISRNPKEKSLQTLRDRLSKSSNIDDAMRGKGATSDADSVKLAFDEVNKLFGKYGGSMDSELQAVKNAIYDSLEDSGVEGAKKARDIYRVAQGSKKVQSKLSEPSSITEKSMATLISQLESPNEGIRSASRKILREKIGPKADSIIKDADARILREQNIGKVKKATGIGLLFGGAKYGANKFRDAIQQMKK